MKKAQKRFVMLAVGILAALAIVLSQLFYYQTGSYSKKEVKSEQQQDQSQSTDDEAFFSIPSSSLPSSTHVDVTTKSFYLLEILTDGEQVEENNEQIAFPLGTFLQTLFNTIISPNAP